jgi:hypothetical protein
MVSHIPRESIDLVNEDDVDSISRLPASGNQSM